MELINTKKKNIYIVDDLSCNTRKSLLNIKNNNDDNSIYIYKSEFNNKTEIINQMIKYHDNELKNKVYGRECVIKFIDDKNIKSSFLKDNHILGNDKSSIIYGAYNGSDLLAIMTFDDKRNMSSGSSLDTYELTRFCVKNDIIVCGIFNKILKKFINDYKPKKILSFADRRFSIRKNNIYENNGFRLIKTLGCDYKYISKDNPTKLYHKFGFGKSSIKKKFPKIYDKNKTEYEMMSHLNYSQVWDCGKYRYELELDNNFKPIFGFIYKIINNINSKVYIGQTTRNIDKRIYEYKKAINYDKFYNKYLQNAFKKNGWDHFEFSVIDTASSMEELNQKEIEYIIKYRSNTKEYGYNIEFGGRNSIPSEETLNKMSSAAKGRKQSEEWVRKRIPPKGSLDAKKHGRKKSKEEKKYLSDHSPKFWLGKKRSEETKKKISKTKIKNGLTHKQKKKICKRVIAFSPTTNKIIDIFESTEATAKFYDNISQSTISRRCNGTSKNKGHIYFKYEN